jgi:hypothetical protein
VQSWIRLEENIIPIWWKIIGQPWSNHFRSWSHRECVEAGRSKEFFKFVDIDRFRRLYAWSMTFNWQQFKSFPCTPKLEDTVTFNFDYCYACSLIRTFLKIMIRLCALRMTWGVITPPRLDDIECYLCMDSYWFHSRSSLINLSWHVL